MTMVKIKEAEYKKLSELTDEQRYYYNEGRDDPKIIQMITLFLLGIMFGLMIADLLHTIYPNFFD